MSRWGYLLEAEIATFILDIALFHVEFDKFFCRAICFAAPLAFLTLPYISARG